MPGVLILEALAQTGAVAILSLPENRGKTAYFAGIDKAKFKQMVLPGDRLKLECETDGAPRGHLGAGDHHYPQQGTGGRRGSDRHGKRKTGGESRTYLCSKIKIVCGSFL